MSDQPHDFQPVIWECAVCGVKFDQEFHKPTDMEEEGTICDECMEDFFTYCETCDVAIRNENLGPDGECPACENIIKEEK